MDKNTLEKAASTLAPDMPRKQKTRILMEILRAEPDFFSPEHLFIGDPGEYENEIARRTASIVWAAAASGEHREQMTGIINGIVESYDTVAKGAWRGQQSETLFFIKGEDVVVTTQQKAFITVLKGGAENARVKNARRIRVLPVL